MQETQEMQVQSLGQENPLKIPLQDSCKKWSNWEYILKEPADFGDILIVGYQKSEDNQSSYHLLG